MPALPHDIRTLFTEPNYVHLSTLRADGSPRNWVVWVDVERDDAGNDLVLVCTGDGAWKAKDMMRDTRVALSVCDLANPYRMAAIQGKVVEVRNDAESSYMDRISHKYTGKPFPARGPGRVCFAIEAAHAGGRTLSFVHEPAADAPA